MDKLKEYGCQPAALKLMQNYLTGRYKRKNFKMFRVRGRK